MFLKGAQQTRMKYGSKLNAQLEPRMEWKFNWTVLLARGADNNLNLQWSITGEICGLNRLSELSKLQAFTCFKAETWGWHLILLHDQKGVRVDHQKLELQLQHLTIENLEPWRHQTRVESQKIGPGRWFHLEVAICCHRGLWGSIQSIHQESGPHGEKPLEILIAPIGVGFPTNLSRDSPGWSKSGAPFSQWFFNESSKTICGIIITAFLDPQLDFVGYCYIYIYSYIYNYIYNYIYIHNYIYIYIPLHPHYGWCFTSILLVKSPQKIVRPGLPKGIRKAHHGPQTAIGAEWTNKFGKKIWILNLKHPFWIILDPFGSFWIILDHFGSFGIISDHFGSFRIILDHFGTSSYSEVKPFLGQMLVNDGECTNRLNMEDWIRVWFWMIWG